MRSPTDGPPIGRVHANVVRVRQEQDNSRMGNLRPDSAISSLRLLQFVGPACNGKIQPYQPFAAVCRRDDITRFPESGHRCRLAAFATSTGPVC